MQQENQQLPKLAFCLFHRIDDILLVFSLAQILFFVLFKDAEEIIEFDWLILSHSEKESNFQLKLN